MSIQLTRAQLAAIGVCAAFMPGLMSSCGSGGDRQMQSVPEIATITVAPTSANQESTFPAQIKGKTDIEIRPQVTGFITKVLVDEGQKVRKGQPLFTLDQVTFQAAVDQAQASVANARTAVNTAQMTVDSKRALYAQNIISEYDLQTAENSLAQAKAALAQAEAGLATARKNMSYTVVTAPSDGVVGNIPNREGSLASPSSVQPLTTVSDNSQVYAYFSLTEKDILSLSDGGAKSVNEAVASMPAVQLILADGTVYPVEGKVATVSGVIDPATGAASVRALFDNTNGMLRSGSTGNVVLPNMQQDVIVIPQRATNEMQNLRYAYVVNDSNVIVQTAITVTPLPDGQNFIVNTGLNPGDRVAVEGIGMSVRNGAVIKPVDAAAKAAQPQQTQGE